MRNEPIGNIIRDRRKELGKSLRKLALDLNVNHQRLSEIERDESEAEEQLLASIAEQLKLPTWKLHTTRVPYCPRLANAFRHRVRYRPKGDRPTSKRIAAAWKTYPRLMASLEPRLPS